MGAATSVAGVMVLAGGATAAFGLVDLEVEEAKQPGFVDVDCNAGIRTDLAHGCFEEHGDELWIRDMEGDGKRVAIHWRLTDNSRRGLCWNASGVGQAPPGFEDSGPWMVCEKDYIEGKRIIIRVGTCDGDVSPCRTVEQYGEWSGWDGATT